MRAGAKTGFRVMTGLKSDMAAGESKILKFFD